MQKIKILKQFNNNENFLNPTGYGDIVLYRRERINDKNYIVSDIVDVNNNIILEHEDWGDELISYEDPRFITKDIITVNQVKYTKEKNKFTVFRVSVLKFNLKEKKLEELNCFYERKWEKNWQFFQDKIIYSLNPYILLNDDCSVYKERYITWDRWTEKYGIPYLSTNLFNIDGELYSFFHSKVKTNHLSYQYYNGIVKYDEQLNILGYYEDPIHTPRDIMCKDLYSRYFEWKRKAEQSPTIVNTLFFMTAYTELNKLFIYTGINDCAAGIIEYEKEEFKNILRLNTFKKF